MLEKEVVEDILPPDWSAAAWLLERKYQDWSPRKADDDIDPADVAKRIRMALVQIDERVPPPDSFEKYTDKSVEESPIIDIPAVKKQERGLDQ